MPSEPPNPSDMMAWAEAINQALKRYSDKDWNYSRILLVAAPLAEMDSSYVLAVEWLNMKNREGRTDYKTSMDEVAWGERHSRELGMLEIASLRLNRALAETTTDEYWHYVRPVVRLQKRFFLLEKGQTHAFGYQVREVQGEEFENR